MDNLYNSRLKVLQRSVLALAIIAGGAAVVVARDFIYPVGLGVLLSYLVYPLAKFLEKQIKHRGAATLISVMIAVIIFIGFFFLLYQQLSIFIDDFPKLQSQAVANITDVQNYISQRTPFSFSSEDSLKDRLMGVFEAQENFISQLFSATTATLVALGVQPVYIFFMLYYRHHFRNFLFQITNKKDHGVLDTILLQITVVTKNYVTGIFIVVLILCVINSLGLWIVGIQYALLLGIISAIFNFIPYFGTLIGGAVPFLFALVSPNPSDAIGVVILFIIVQFMENNILTPNITGGRVAINPLFTIFAIILGGLAWGIPGMLLSVPFLGIFKVVCENVPVLRPIAYVLSSIEAGRKRRQKEFSSIITDPTPYDIREKDKKM